MRAASCMAKAGKRTTSISLGGRRYDGELPSLILAALLSKFPSLWWACKWQLGMQLFAMGAGLASEALATALTSFTALSFII